MSGSSVLNSSVFLIHIEMLLNESALLFLIPLLISLGCHLYFLFFFIDTIWTSCPGTDKKWRLETARGKLKQYHSESTYRRRTEDIMSTSVKQERTICVLLPNKEQMDITVRVSVLMSCAVLLTVTKRWVQFCLSQCVFALFLCECIVNIDFFFVFVFSPAPAKVHGAGCFQSCGGAPRSQRAVLLWPHSGEG